MLIAMVSSGLSICSMTAARRGAHSGRLTALPVPLVALPEDRAPAHVAAPPVAGGSALVTAASVPLLRLDLTRGHIVAPAESFA